MRISWHVAWVGSALLAACDTSTSPPVDDPGPLAAACEAAPAPALHRLSRRQLGYALEDLLDVDAALSLSLPADLQDGGLDVTTEAQRLDTPWASAWLRVAAEAISSVFDGAGDVALRVDPAEAATTEVALTHDEPLAVFTEAATIGWDIDIPEAGVYAVDLIGRRQTLFQEGDALVDDDAIVVVQLDGTLVERVVLVNEGDEGLHHVTEVVLEPGRHRLTAQIVPSATRFASVASIHVRPSVGEAGPRRRSPALDRWVTCNPRGDAACVREVVGSFARVAWRGPVTEEAIDRLIDLVEASGGADVYDGLGAAFLATLLDPAFLFLVEAPAEQGPRTRSPHELAARWATVLWESVPDVSILACADTAWQAPGCSEDEVLDQMLQDPRTDRFLHNLVVGWLGLDALDVLSEQGAALDAPLRAAMTQSAVERLRRVLLDGASVASLLAAPTTWVDATLAAHYGVAASTGWVEVPGRMQGWLTDAATLAAHSQVGRTSPTRRGRFLWERLHCLEVGERPAVIPSVDDVAPGAGIESVLASIGEDPACAACHNHLDPLGLSLEGFDAVGRAREVAPLERSWALEDGTELGSPEAVVAWLTRDDAFAACAASFLGTWLVQAVPTPAVACAIGPLDAASSGAAWLRDALRSDAFRRRGEDEP
ncbi:MAG: hypothetical protein RLZZ383_3058 [Pseudomonadota bacterium]